MNCYRTALFRQVSGVRMMFALILLLLSYEFAATWLEDALRRARDVSRENARRAVSSHQGGFDDGWVEALERVQAVCNTEGNQTMNPTPTPPAPAPAPHPPHPPHPPAPALNFFKLIQVAGEVMTDLPSLEAMAAGLAKGQLPTPAEIALLVKLIEDVKAAV